MERKEAIKVLESKGYKASSLELEMPSIHEVSSFDLSNDNTFTFYNNNNGDFKIENWKDAPRAVVYTFAGSFTKKDIMLIYICGLDLSNAPDETRSKIIQKDGYIVKIFYNQEKEVYKVSYRKNPKVKE